MGKNLVAFALTGLVFTMSTDLARAENLELELNNKEPHEQVQDYLDPFGVAREEFRVNHYFFIYDVTTHYNRTYDFGGKPFIEQYDITNLIVPNKKGVSLIIHPYPTAYFFEGIWYLDPFRDGFNGNEIKGGSLKESVKPTKKEFGI